jgi:hypothetical protein
MIQDARSHEIKIYNEICIIVGVLDFLTPDNGTDGLFRNVGKKLPLYAA